MSHLTPVPTDPEALQAWLTTRGQEANRSFESIRNPPVNLPEAPATSSLLTVTVTLTDSTPPVWRRLRLPGSLTLDVLHDVLQTAMGWADSHLHRFHAGSWYQDPYFVTAFDIEKGGEGTPETDVRLDQLLREPGDRFLYTYDFGDGWDHDVLLEEVGPLDGEQRPHCVGGARACPPEDAGGIPGLQDLVAWHQAGRTAETLPDVFDSVEDALDWLPRDWDPEAFDAGDADTSLRAKHAASGVLEQLRPEAAASILRLGADHADAATWLGSAALARELSEKDLDELTEPWRRLLTVLGRPVELSKAGWLPAEYVAELCDVLHVHPILAGNANRESNVRPVAAFRKVAMQVGLLHKQHGMLMPTLKGMQLRDDAAGLWAHIAGRLPVGRSEISQDAGWFTLLALAGGADHHAVYDDVHSLLVDAGWGTTTGRELDRWETPSLVWPTLDVLLGPRRMDLEPSPPWLPPAAADVLMRSTSGS